MSMDKKNIDTKLDEALKKDFEFSLPEGFTDSVLSKVSLANEKSDQKNQLEIISERERTVPGTHSVTYQSGMDEIEIKHTAHTRDSFALGAIFVAEWIKDKAGFLTMDDFIKLND